MGAWWATHASPVQTKREVERLAEPDVLRNLTLMTFLEDRTPMTNWAKASFAPTRFGMVLALESDERRRRPTDVDWPSAGNGVNWG